MPLPQSLARVNRRFTNPIISRFAGRVAPLAIIVHVGRKSGRQLQNPIMAFPVPDGFAVALTYGLGTDWQKNVEAASGCGLVYRHTRWALTNPRIVTRESTADAFPRIVRLILRANGVSHVMLLDKPGT